MDLCGVIWAVFTFGTKIFMNRQFSSVIGDKLGSGGNCAHFFVSVVALYSPGSSNNVDACKIEIFDIYKKVVLFAWFID